MPTSGMLRRVALLRTGVSEEHSASFIRVTRPDVDVVAIVFILCSDPVYSMSSFVFCFNLT
jgi:hypothetical protein